MYFNGELNWIKICRKKRIYIFGAGKNGEKLFHQLQDEGNIEVAGVIDNSREVVDKCVSGLSWIKAAYMLDEYKKIQKSDDLIIISTAISEIEEQLLEERIYPFINYTQLDFSGVEGAGRYNADYLSERIERKYQ